MNPTRSQIRELLRTVVATEAREIDCDEFLARVGAFLENLSRGSGPPPELRLVAQHLKICSECREEFEALLELHSGPDR